MSDSTPYQFTPYENELIKRLTFNTFLKSKEFNFARYPEVHWIPEDRRIKRMFSYNYALFWRKLKDHRQNRVSITPYFFTAPFDTPFGLLRVHNVQKLPTTFLSKK
jgi:hypothetical protein